MSTTAPTPFTVRHALAQSGLVPVDAQVLLAHVLGVGRAWLIAHATDPLPRDRADAFFALAKRRREGEPVAYLTGRREFHGLDLDVSPAVLVPRPETETLVDCAIEHLLMGRPLAVVDLRLPDRLIASLPGKAEPASLTPRAPPHATTPPPTVAAPRPVVPASDLPAAPSREITI